ncbi:beta-carotene 15,15'-monooxygenase, partial [Bifidobacteriaceae bacterium VN003]
MSNETRICNDKMQKNDNSCVNVQKHTRIPSMNALAMFVSQIFVVVLLAIAAILPIATAKITLILCLIIMLTFIALWPLHGNVIDRAIALCAGIAST